VRVVSFRNSEPCVHANYETEVMKRGNAPSAFGLVQMFH